jgi:hypothetical protein
MKTETFIIGYHHQYDHHLRLSLVVTYHRQGHLEILFENHLDHRISTFVIKDGSLFEKIGNANFNIEFPLLYLFL